MTPSLPATLLSLAAAVALAGCAPTKTMISTPLTWNPSDDVAGLHAVTATISNGWGGTLEETGPDLTGQVVDAFLGQKLQVLPFTDARAHKDAIGQNLQNSQPRPVTTTDNVADFVTAHVTTVLKACHAPVVTGGATRLLKGEVAEYFVKEDNQYDGNVLLHFTLTDAAGSQLWSGSVLGHESEHGRSFSADDYNQDLSDSLIRAVHKLLMDPAFLLAVHKGTK